MSIKRNTFPTNKKVFINRKKVSIKNRVLGVRGLRIRPTTGAAEEKNRPFTYEVVNGLTDR